MADIINKFYKKIANNGSDSDYELVGEIGVGGKSLEDYLMHSDAYTTIFDHIYPVGSIYLSVTNENPSNKFGGTWVSWGAGKFIVGVNGDDSSFNTVEKTGGSKTHSHTITVNNKAAFTSEVPHLQPLNYQMYVEISSCTIMLSRLIYNL